MHDLDDNDDYEVKDGESVRVPVFLTDTIRFEDGEPHFVRARAAADADLDLADHHQPGYRLADARLRDAARASRAAWIQKITDAWRTPSRDVLGGRGQNQTDPRQINRSALSHEPDLMRGEPDDEPDHDDHDIDAVMARHQRRRDDAWAQYRDDLQNAWKRGRNTDPKEADRIMRQGERWRGGR
jgi:hypothetical protein